MKNLIIVGTSGVGKTFLEGELEKCGLYTQIPIYSDRLPRIGEDHKSIICLSRKSFKQNRGNFSFCMKYCGHNYGWKDKDLIKSPISIDISFDDLDDFMKIYPNFLPVILEITLDDLPMLKRRMEKRGDNSKIIETRLSKTKEELKNMDEYRKIIQKYNGLIFQIKDDKTIFEEVIPELARRR